MIQVAGGSTIPGENYNCLLPLRKKGKSEYMETIATTVPTILKDIPIVDIKELARDVYQEYTNECRHKGTTPSCKLEYLSTEESLPCCCRPKHTDPEYSSPPKKAPR